jgi:Response regulators consisting of a CheY-like receiver domain and a winged-helix DNA-binding domain
MRKIMVIEDDDSIREMIVYALSTAGLYGVGIADGDSGLKLLEEQSPDLILLDIMLPGIDGITILKKLKQSKRYKKIPIIMLTAKSSEVDRIKGLDLGADDYITKPFSVMEVISRVKAVLRRCANVEEVEDKLVVGKISLYKSRRVVCVKEQEVILTYKEFELLQYLMLNVGIALKRDKLLEEIWGYDYQGESRTVDMHINTLRHKLCGAGDIIKTIRNVGYKIGG